MGVKDKKNPEISSPAGPAQEHKVFITIKTKSVFEVLKVYSVGAYRASDL